MGELCMMDSCVSPGWLLVCAVIGCHSAWYMNSPVLSTCIACSNSAAKWCYVLWLVLHTVPLHTKNVTLGFCMACDCGVLPLSAAAFMSLWTNDLDHPQVLHCRWMTMRWRSTKRMAPSGRKQTPWGNMVSASPALTGPPSATALLPVVL